MIRHSAWCFSLLAALTVLADRADAAVIPTPTKVVIVIEENHSYSTIIGNANASYMNTLASQGALFTNSFDLDAASGQSLSSQPNYLGLFSGSTQGITNNNVFPRFSGPNLASELQAVGKTFQGYFDGMPSNGYDGASFNDYMRKHNPVTQFTNLAPGGDNSAVNRIFNTANFPIVSGTDYSFLPTVSMVVPDQNHDMHDGSIADADAWLSTNLGVYANWALANNSLLILTWDEPGAAADLQIVTVFYGPMVVPGTYSETINHYNVLRTIEEMYGTAHANNAATAAPITDVWVQETQAVPEPSTGALAIVGLLCLGWIARRARPKQLAPARQAVAQAGRGVGADRGDAGLIRALLSSAGSAAATEGIAAATPVWAKTSGTISLTCQIPPRGGSEQESLFSGGQEYIGTPFI